MCDRPVRVRFHTVPHSFLESEIRVNQCICYDDKSVEALWKGFAFQITSGYTAPRLALLQCRLQRGLHRPHYHSSQVLVVFAAAVIDGLYLDGLEIRASCFPGLPDFSELRETAE